MLGNKNAMPWKKDVEDLKEEVAMQGEKNSEALKDVVMMVDEKTNGLADRNDVNKLNAGLNKMAEKANNLDEKLAAQNTVLRDGLSSLLDHLEDLEQRHTKLGSSVESLELSVRTFCNRRIEFLSGDIQRLSSRKIQLEDVIRSASDDKD